VTSGRTCRSASELDLVVADDGRGLAGIADTMGRGWPDGLAARAAQMMRDVSPKPMERPVGRNLWVSGVCRRPDDGAVLERACRLRGLASNDERGNEPRGNQQALHRMSSLAAFP